jgi:hypothetical protein
MAPAGASASVTLDGSFFTAVIKPNFAGLCPSGVAGECGTMQLVVLGACEQDGEVESEEVKCLSPRILLPLAHAVSRVLL